MSGIWILLLLILSAALPAIIVFFWFRARKSAVTLPWFLAALAAGILSLLIVALIQKFFIPLNKNGMNELGHIFFSIFIRIALVEEASRLITLIPLLKAGSLRKTSQSVDYRSFGASLGLAAGLGFAMIENASYGIADINITLLRAFTAAPLHGACGIRAGAAVFIFAKHPVKSIFLFISAIFIHGAYNLMIVSPALPSILAVLIAFAALFASLPYIRDTETVEEHPVY